MIDGKLLLMLEDTPEAGKTSNLNIELRNADVRMYPMVIKNGNFYKVRYSKKVDFADFYSLMVYEDDKPVALIADFRDYAFGFAYWKASSDCTIREAQFNAPEAEGYLELDF